MICKNVLLILFVLQLKNQLVNKDIFIIVLQTNVNQNHTVQVDILGETIWDAQLGFDFGEAGIDSLDGLAITLQAYNLTEEPFTSLQGDNALQVRDYQDYGSSYLLGFSYKF